MNNTMTRFFGRTISSAAFDLKLGQGVCLLGSVLVGSATWWKMWRLERAGVVAGRPVSGDALGSNLRPLNGAVGHVAAASSEGLPDGMFVASAIS